MRPVGRTARATGTSLPSARCVARPLVVRDVHPENPTKMPLIEDDDVVQTLAVD